jgi:uncharacterized protein (TIGR03086 family)
MDMTAPDFGPAAQRLADLVANVPDDALGGPTPCPAFTLADLLDHVGGFAVFLAMAARKETAAVGGRGGTPSGSQLGTDWRTRIPRDLVALADAWRDPAAWTGMTQAGGIDLPGEVVGLIALDELVVHGWDVARATGQPFTCEHATLDTIRPIFDQFGDNPDPGAPFGRRVNVPADAPLLDQVIGLAGRNPAWLPTQPD